MLVTYSKSVQCQAVREIYCDKYGNPVPKVKEKTAKTKLDESTYFPPLLMVHNLDNGKCLSVVYEFH